MIESATKVAEEALVQIRGAEDAPALNAVRVEFLGKKGTFTQLMKDLKSVEPDKRKDVGALLNKLKQELEAEISRRGVELEEQVAREKIKGERIDVTLPVKAPLLLTGAGTTHPNTQVQRELEEIFLRLGFQIVDGPELEREYYNFEALNIPSTHPARDMQDTFWTEDGDLLRTHTSSIQVRALEQLKPPIRIFAPGRVFRYERLDASHEHTFYQMEGMMIDRQVTVGHLTYFMRTLLREIFGFDPKIRLRPGYFPFVEPGFELDIWFQGKWMELLPCGLVHPEVLRFGGIAPEEWQGFAFGLGLSRLVMSRFEIDDIRHLNSGDIRFLEQFA